MRANGAPGLILAVLPLMLVTSAAGQICNYRDGRGWVPCVDGPPQQTYTPPPPPDPAVLEEQRKAREAADSNEKGLVAMVRGDWSAAANLFSHALELAPENHSYSYNLGQARRHLQAIEDQKSKNREEQQQFERDKADILQNLKTVTAEGTAAGTGELQIKTVTAEDQPRLTPKVEPRIGAAARVSGDVNVIRNGKKEKVGREFAMQLNDHVVLGPDGHLQVLLLDETVFTLGSNSDMILDDFVYDPTTNVSKIVAKIVKGTFRFVTGHLRRESKDSSIGLGKYGYCGIRGTDFEANISESGAGSVTLYGGAIDYTDSKTGEIVSLKPGEQLLIRADGSLRLNKPLVSRPIVRRGRAGR